MFLTLLSFMSILVSCASLSHYKGVGRIRRYTISDSRLPEPFDGKSIAFISDTHYPSKFTRKRLANVTRALDDLAPEDLTYEGLDPDREYYEDKTIIVGHIHTGELPDCDPDMVYYGNGTIFMDCGSDKNGTLGCLCLDNGKEYYVH